jgi:hypothetical protein
VKRCREIFDEFAAENGIVLRSSQEMDNEETKDLFSYAGTVAPNMHAWKQFVAALRKLGRFAVTWGKEETKESYATRAKNAWGERSRPLSARLCFLRSCFNPFLMRHSAGRPAVRCCRRSTRKKLISKVWKHKV